MILQIKQTLSTWLVLFAASLCFFLFSFAPVEHDFPNMFQIWSNSCRNGSVPKRSAGFWSQGGMPLCTMRDFRVFFMFFFASGSTSDWRLYYPGMALMKDTDGSD